MSMNKIRFAIFLPVFLVFFACASVPKTQEPSVSEAVQETLSENAETENNVEAEENNDETSEEPENTELEDSVLDEEKVVPDELEELPVEENPETDDESEAIVIEDEPEVLEAEEYKQDEIAINGESKEDSSKNNETEQQKENEITAAAENSDTTQIEETPENAESSIEPDTELTSEEDNSAEDIENAVVEEIKPSRTITIPKNQFIDIYYPGKGWIYQGCIDEEGNIDSRNKYFVFGGRKLGGEDQCFTLRSRTAGKYILHFYKNDILTGNYIDDYLEVIVEDKLSSSTEHITVPKYAEIVPPKVSITHEKVKEERKKQKEMEASAKAEKEETVENSKASKTASAKKLTDSLESSKTETDENVTTTIQTTKPETLPAVAQTTSPVNSSSPAKINTKSADTAKNESELSFSEEKLDSMNEDKLLELAQKLYESKNFENALKAINTFFDKASKNLDKGLYLQGQILEEKSSVQNIKDAVESYELLVKNYPASKYWEKAKKRSIYLRRFYINIR